MANYSFSTIHAGEPFADGYDAEDRFMRFKRSGVTEDILLTRSNIGNISNVNRNGTNTARGYNTAHGLTTVSGGTTQTYDTDGNTTKLNTNVTAVWDDAGRMKNTNVPAGATAGIVGLNENGYVGGNRVWKKITRSGSVVEHRVYIHAGPNLIAEYNAGVAASTPVQEYVYAGKIDSLVLIRRSDATRYGVTRNRQWSITALHDLANGNIVERYAYEMTGKRTIYAANGTTVRTTSSYGNNFGYTNRWHDEDSGLMYFRARYYNPLTGEFLSRDPMRFVDGASLYRGYFGFNATDPFGWYEVTIQTDAFIPYDWLMVDPWSYVGGDDRDVSKTPLGPDSSRAFSKAIVEMERCIKEQPLVAQSSSVSDSKLKTFKNDNVGSQIITAKGTFEATVTASRTGDCSVQVKMKMSATLPFLFVPFAPAIDWNFTYDIHVFEIEGVGVAISYDLQGKHDGFPAYESYIQSSLIYSYNPEDEGATPWALWGDSDVSADKTGVIWDRGEFVCCECRGSFSDFVVSKGVWRKGLNR